jgi:general secretion pathway protein G
MKLSVFRRAGGFTLIELMVVMTLIVILASIGLTSYTNSVTRSKEAVLKENLFRLRDSIDQYYADKNNYPETLSSLVLERYIRTVPVDPFTQSTDTWQLVMSEVNLEDLSEISGIFDIKSGSQQTALDESQYSDW